MKRTVLNIRSTVVRTALVAIAVLGVASNASAHSAEADWVRYRDVKVHLPVPDGWRVVRDLYGMPITVLGPERGTAERVILNIQTTDVKNLGFDYGVVQKTQNDYFKGRQEWLAKFSETKFLRKFPFRKLAGRPGFEGYELGYAYRMRGLEFDERSFEVSCGGRLYFLKTLTNSKQPAADRLALRKLVDRMECRTVTAADGSEEPSPLRDLDEKFAQRGARAWPALDRIRSAPRESKAAILEAIVEFQKEFEESYGEALYAKNGGAPARLKNAVAALLEGASDLAFTRAVAEGNFDCFYAGWPSRFMPKGSGVTCASPADTNPAYSKGECGDGSLACNPSLFGPGICVSIASANERAHATLRCETKFRATGKSYEDVVKSPDFDPGRLTETVQAAKGVCTAEPYLTQNFGLCSTLKEKLHLSLEASGAGAGDDTDQQFVNGIDGLKPENYDRDLDEMLKQYSVFEKDCFDEKGELKTETPGCLDGLRDWTEDFDRLERMHNAIGEELQQTEPVDETGKMPDCPNGNCADPQQSDVSANAAGGSCTQDEIATVKSGECKFSSPSWWFKTGAGCGYNVFMSAAKSLWSAVKGIGDLVVTGAKYVGKKASQGWHWLMRKVGIESSTSEKAHVAAQTSNGLLGELLTHPIDTTVSLVKSIVDAVSNYIKNDVFCQDWSGAAHFSTCTKPANFSCISCTALVSGTCSMLGYAIGEFVPAILTGGATAGLKAAGVGGKIASLLGKAGKTGKLATMTEKMVTKFPKISRAVMGAKRAQKFWAKAGKAGAVPRWWGAKKLALVKRAYKISGSKLTAFKSLRWGDFKTTLAKLRAARAKLMAKKPSGWVVRNLVKRPANIAGKIATAPVRYPYRWTKGLARAYVRKTRNSANTGFKWSQKIANRITAGATANMKAPGYLKYVAYAAVAAKYPPRVSRFADSVVRRIEASGYSDAEIEQIAKEQNRKPAEVRAELKQQRSDSFVTERIAENITSGKDTEQDVADFARLQQIPIDDARNSFVLRKIDEAATGGAPKFSKAEYEAWAKVNGTPVESAEKDLQAAIAERKKQIEEETRLLQEADQSQKNAAS